MTFLRTLEYTIMCAILFSFLLALSFLESMPTTLIMVSLLSGFIFYYFFKELSPDDVLERISIIYIPASIVVIIEGTFTNVIKSALEMITRPGLGSIPALTSIFSHRNILFELAVLFIGLFGPFVLLESIKKQPIEYKRLFWNIISIAVIYIVMALIVQYLIWPRIAEVKMVGP